jgi:hypothetical protein
MFRVLSAPIIRSTIKTADAVVGTIRVSVWCDLNPFKDVQDRGSHYVMGHSEIDSRT